MSKDSNEKDPLEPAWLSADYDERHREESQPLFGTGDVDLTDRGDSSSHYRGDSSHYLDDDIEGCVSSGVGIPSAIKSVLATTGIAYYGSTTSVAADDTSYNPNNSDDGNGGGGNDETQSTTSSQKKRVGQNLLLRDVIFPDEDDDKNDDDADYKELHSNKKTNTYKSTRQQQQQLIKLGKEPNPFGKSKIRLDKEPNPFGKSNIPENPNLFKPHVPPPHPVLWLFNALQGLGTVASLCLMLTQVLPIFYCHPFQIQIIIQQIGLLPLALKCYIVLFCCIFVITEIDAPVPFIQNAQLLQGFGSRGFLYSFVGLICVEEAYSERVKTILIDNNRINNADNTGIMNGVMAGAVNVNWAAIFMEVSSWFMLGVGVTYMLLGICCLKRYRDKLKQKERTEWKNYREGMRQWKALYK